MWNNIRPTYCIVVQQQKATSTQDSIQYNTVQKSIEKAK